MGFKMSYSGVHNKKKPNYNPNILVCCSINNCSKKLQSHLFLRGRRGRDYMVV